jgi:hypothetical protein
MAMENTREQEYQEFKRKRQIAKELREPLGMIKKIAEWGSETRPITYGERIGEEEFIAKSDQVCKHFHIPL